MATHTTASKPNAAAATAPPPVPPAQQGTPAPEKAARTRNALSMERRLTLALINVLTVTATAKLKDPSLEVAQALVKDVQEKVIGPARARVSEIYKEMTAATADPTKIDATKIIALGKELAAAQKKLGAVQG